MSKRGSKRLMPAYCSAGEYPGVTPLAGRDVVGEPSFLKCTAIPKSISTGTSGPPSSL